MLNIGNTCNILGFRNTCYNSLAMTMIICIFTICFYRYIRLPETPEEKMELKVQFYGLARFPKVIGAKDCTHIKLQCPSRENGELYRNRKGYFSLNVQALVNANLEFMDVVVRWQNFLQH